MPLRLPLFALALIALALAGCGDSNNTTGGGDAAKPEPLTKTELVAQADKICQDMQKKIDEIASPETIEDLEAAISQQMEISGPAIEDLKALTPPEDLASDYESWLAKLEQMQEGTGRVRDAAAAGSQEEVQSIVQEVDSTNKEADKIGKAIGFKYCAK